MKIMNMIRQSATALIIAVISLAGYVSTPDGVITMTTAMEDEVMFYLAGTGDAVIDWGDDSTPDTVILQLYSGLSLAGIYTAPVPLPSTDKTSHVWSVRTCK